MREGGEQQYLIGALRGEGGGTLLITEEEGEKVTRCSDDLRGGSNLRLEDPFHRAPLSLSLTLSLSLSIYLSLSLSVCLFLCYLCVSQCVSRSVDLSLDVWLAFCLSVCLSIGRRPSFWLLLLLLLLLRHGWKDWRRSRPQRRAFLEITKTD